MPLVPRPTRIDQFQLDPKSRKDEKLAIDLINLEIVTEISSQLPFTVLENFGN